MQEPSRANISPKWLILIVAQILFLIVGFGVGYTSSQIKQQIVTKNISVEKEQEIGQKDELSSEVYNHIVTQYIRKDVDPSKLRYGSLRGMVEALGDQYTVFLSPEEVVEYNSNSAGQFEGIGTTLRYNGEYTIIESPIEGFPANKSGLMSGDVILQVNGEDMKNKRASYVASKILGPAGSNVKIKVYRSKDEKFYEKEITRAKIDMKNLELKETEDGINVIKIHKFTESSVKEFRKEWDTIVEKVKLSKNHNVVLDLRNNPGGYVDAGLYVIEEFVEEGRVIMKEEDREGNQVIKKSSRTGELRDYSLVVLVNEGSASASEIVSSALQDNGRAKIIGKSTVGKGVEQTLINLSDGSMLQLVFKKWITPNGRNINQESPISPDIEVELSTEDFEKGRDPQMDKAVAVLGELSK